MNVIWLLTEERPKVNIIHDILKLEYELTMDTSCKVVPILDELGKFSFVYRVVGMTVTGFDEVLIKIVSGHSSFVDYLVFENIKMNTDSLYHVDLTPLFNNKVVISMPSPEDIPKYVVEETKTDDHESRNTNAYQRSSKFVYCEQYYEADVTRYIVYDISDKRTLAGTKTHEFGMRMLVTIGVHLIGVKNDYEPFTDLNEFIEIKNKIAAGGPSHNIPLTLHLDEANAVVRLSAKLDKGKGSAQHKISNDPNIGAVAIISAVLRKLGWTGEILLTRHNLHQSSISRGNKLLYIMKKLGVEFDGLTVDWAKVVSYIDYWYYEKNSEKIGSIYYHLFVEEHQPEATVLFDNHAGCGKSYFRTPNGILAVTKTTKLPDLVVYDEKANVVKVIEAERDKNVLAGVTQLDGFTDFINNYVLKYYPGARIEKSVITWGKSTNPHVSFYLDYDGTTVFVS